MPQTAEALTEPLVDGDLYELDAFPVLSPWSVAAAPDYDPPEPAAGGERY
jgi:hypothetical protein